jgi:hypothetical protein
VLVGVQPPQRLAEHLADAVAAVRPDRLGRADALGAPVIADRVVGAGEDDALHALPARRLEGVVAADDVVGVDRLPIRLDRRAAQVHHRVDPVHGRRHRGRVAEIGLVQLLAGRRRAQRADVRETQPR